MGIEDSHGKISDVESQEFYSWLNSQLQSYEKRFDFSPADLKNKKILEIGARDRRVAAACIIGNVTKEVYSLEPALGSRERKEGYADPAIIMGVMEALPEDIRKEIDSKTIIATAEEIPCKDNSFDFAIGRSVNLESEVQLVRRIRELLRVSSEIRLFPITEDNRDVFERALGEISKNIPVDVQFKTTNVAEFRSEQGMERISEDVVIIRKRAVKNV